jgi:hypothetical protein
MPGQGAGAGAAGAAEQARRQQGTEGEAAESGGGASEKGASGELLHVGFERSHGRAEEAVRSG